MTADNFLLNLPKVSLATKDNLPNHSGIYYVVDEKNIVWYIGKAKNIRSRWSGKSHHRFFQLESQKNHYFSIHYRRVDSTEITKIEKEEIEKYAPQLNTSKVKTKTFRPTETLLRETLIKIQEFAFVIGIEYQTKELTEINPLLGRRKNTQSPVIHIAINPILIKQKFLSSSDDNVLDVIHSMFQTRKQYAKKWEVIPKFYKLGVSIYRLYVNNYIIEYGVFISQLVTQELPLNFNSTFLAQEAILALSEDSLAKLKNRIVKQNERSYFTYIIQNLTAYNDDLVNIHFNETVEKEKLEKALTQTCGDYESGKKGFGSRSQNIENKKRALYNLANIKGVNTNKKYDNVINVKNNDQLGVYITPFNFDLKQKSPFFQSAYAVVDGKLKTCNHSHLSDIFLLEKVDRIAWLIFAEYLTGFAKIAVLPEVGTGFIDKLYISKRRYVKPAKVNIKILDIDCSVWLPFGQSLEFPNYVDAKQEIKKRLNNAGFSSIKISFKQESIIS
jgi:hypothetical protein